jgi:hypothetical protein
MTDLTTWDFAPDFSAVEVAALIAGDHPIVGHAKAIPAHARLKRDYEALLGLFIEYADLAVKIDREKKSATENPLGEIDTSWLQSLGQMIDSTRHTGISSIWLSHVWKGRNWPSAGYFKSTLNALTFSNNAAIEVQRFSRKEISRWLLANELRSAYRFDLNQGQVVEGLIANGQTDTVSGLEEPPPATDKTGQWWETKHDIFEMARNIGARLKSQGKKTSNTEISKEIEKTINGIERGKASGLVSPSWDTIRGRLAHWRWKSE